MIKLIIILKIVHIILIIIIMMIIMMILIVLILVTVMVIMMMMMMMMMMTTIIIPTILIILMLEQSQLARGRSQGHSPNRRRRSTLRVPEAEHPRSEFLLHSHGVLIIYLHDVELTRGSPLPK